MVVKMNLRVKTKNDAADPEIGFLTKSIQQPNRPRIGHADSVGVNCKFLSTYNLCFFALIQPSFSSMIPNSSSSISIKISPSSTLKGSSVNGSPNSS